MGISVTITGNKRSPRDSILDERLGRLRFMPSEFGPLLKALRVRAGFGLRKFAQMIDMPAPNLCDLEHGRRNPPSDPDRLRAIAEFLGLTEGSPDWEQFFDAARSPE